MYINFCVSSGNNWKKKHNEKFFLKKNIKNLLQNRLYFEEKKIVLQERGLEKNGSEIVLQERHCIVT